MGFRLYVSTSDGLVPNYSLSYGKLYSYVESEDLKSLTYLKSLKLLNEDEIWCLEDGFGDISVELTNEQFLEFETLYRNDFKTFCETDVEEKIWDDEDKSTHKLLMESKSNKILTWG